MLNPGAVLIAVAAVVFIFCLVRGLKTEGCVGRLFVVFLIGTIIITIIICKKGG